MSRKRRHFNIQSDYNQRLDLILEKKEKRLPKMRQQVALARRVLENTDVLTDSLVNAVFKQKMMLKNYRKPPGDWSEEQVENIKVVGKKHSNYLRRLKGKDASKLTRDEVCKIREFIDRNERWCEDVESNRELTEFLGVVAPILSEYEEEERRLQKVRKTETDERIRREAELAAKRKERRRVIHTPVSAKGNAMLQLMGVTKELEREVPTGASVLDPGTDMSMDSIVGQSATDARLLEIQSRYLVAVGERQESFTLVDQGLLCPTCGVARVVDLPHAEAICPKCACTAPYDAWGRNSIPFSEKRDIVRTGGNYERLSHFLEWLRNVSGQTTVAESVYEQVYRECQRLGIRSLVDQKTRRLLRRLGLTNEYDNVVTITRAFNGVPPARFSDDQRATLITDFTDAQEPFDRCPDHIKQRKNFLSYSYFLHQMCRMRDWDQYLSCFPLLQGKQNLRRHDLIWKWMINYKKEHGIGDIWTFYPTI